MAAKTKRTVPSVARMLREIETPEGFEREERVEPATYRGARSYKVLKLSGDGITIEVWFTGGRDSYFLADGHVTFTTNGHGTRTFDRYGVEDSFYIANPAQWDEHQDVIAEANETIREFIATKVPEARARLERSERVPGLPFEVTPEKRESVAKALRTNPGWYSFTPAGFGTGYRLVRGRSRYGERAPEETERFFGVSPLYVETFDHD